MKKMLVFCCVWFVLLFLGCAGTEQDYLATIENQYPQPVTYKIGDLSENTIAAGASVTIDRPKNQYMVYYNDEKHIALKTEYLTNSHWKYTFSPRTAYTIEVTNGLGAGISAELSAEGWMEEEPFQIAADALTFTDSDLKVYISNPVFSVVASNGAPAVAVYNLVGTTFKVTLQWSK
jgi:hypothetical protein